MQLAGELSKVNLASLIRLVRNGELTGKICLTQGVNTAFLFFEQGDLVHVDSDLGAGREALLELFLWQSGTFSYLECTVSEAPRSLPSDVPLESLLKEGINYQESRRYLEQLRINFRTVLQAVVESKNDPFLQAMDGRTALADVVTKLRMARSQYIPRLRQIIEKGHAVVVELPNESGQLTLPDWVVSRLKQDNPDISKAIVDLVIWTDRIKCWLYQADVDFQRLIENLEGQSREEPGRSAPGLSPDYEHSFLPGDDNEEDYLSSSPHATVDNTTRESSSASEQPKGTS